jgi:UDP-N-acetylglucosamine--N-acetylmuramyl-(pentapeptide) pyrophosphoryl-undecaprenol N-acetylglucosamine transferase
VGGTRDAALLAQRRRDLPSALQERYTLHPYLQAAEMARALAAADLALCRSGAGAMAELPAVGLPAVLVPGAFSHQDLNARHMAAGGAATVIPDEQLDAAALCDAVLGLLADPARRAAMAACSRALARPGAAEHIARLVAATARYST